MPTEASTNNLQIVCLFGRTKGYLGTDFDLSVERLGEMHYWVVIMHFDGIFRDPIIAIYIVHFTEIAKNFICERNRLI